MQTESAAEQTFTNCVECGQINIPGKKHCEKCGSRLYQRCRRCAAKNSTEARFCHSCARPLRKSFARSIRRKIPARIRKMSLLPIVLFLIFVPLGFKVIMFVVGSLSNSAPAE